MESSLGRLRRVLCLAVPLVLAASLAGIAGAVGGGDFDATFGTDGRRAIDLGASDVARAMVVQPDGKIVLVGIWLIPGYSAAAIVRLNPDGNPDPSFGLGGAVLIPNAFGFAAALQPDGKILVGAHAYDDMFLFRLLPNGSFDASFGNGGFVSTDFGGTEATFALAVQPDGKIVAAGRATTLHSLTPGDFAVVRYNPNGSRDSSFGADGKVRTDFGGTEDALDLALQPDGKIVVVGAAGWSGSQWAVARYNPDGSLDSSFDGDGKVVTDFGRGQQGAWGVAVQPDGKIVVAGWSANQSGGARAFALARYEPNGQLDESFGDHGRVTTGGGGSDTGLDVVLQPNGKIVVAGQTGPEPDFTLERFLPDGREDGSFGSGLNSVQTDFGGHDPAWAVALDPEGRIVAAGGSREESSGGDMTVARVLVGACLVPSLKRLTLDDAQATLEDAGCRLGSVGNVKSKKVKRGRVVSQSPRAGTRLDDFAAVNVVLSRGRR
jgi:uncharacterized delta-60 repeat protein